MPPKLRERIKSAKERIEAFPEAAKKEMGWHRGKTGELRPAAIHRKKDEVFLEKPNPYDKSIIHTHTYPSGIFHTKGDLWQFFDVIKKTKIRNTHIATLDKNGRVIGYVSIKATEKLVEWVKNNYPPKSFLGPQLWENLNYLKREKFVIIKVRPMPGYELEKRRFVKKQRN